MSYLIHIVLKLLEWFVLFLALGGVVFLLLPLFRREEDRPKDLSSMKFEGRKYQRDRRSRARLKGKLATRLKKARVSSMTVTENLDEY